MKNLSFVILVTMALSLVACGKKNESGSGSSSFSSDPYKVSTVKGTIVMTMVGQMTQYSILAGNRTYQPADQQSHMLIQNEVMRAYNSGIPAINGNQLKANITGSVPQMNNQYNNQMGNQMGNQAGNLLQISRVEIYR